LSPPLVPLILSGGSGTRLWPLSRADRPKQFLPLIGDESLFQQTFARLRSIAGGTAPPIVICNDDHRFLVAEQLRELGVAPGAIVLEPAGRNTAPAVAAAALAAQSTTTEDPVLLVLPADHVVRSADRFAEAVAVAAGAARAGSLVTFGVVPDRAETGYGYLRKGASAGGWSALDEFVEKPDLATAERYLASGDYLWNSGMFVFTANAYLAELALHEPAMLEACRRAFAGAERERDFLRLGTAFLESRSESIDYAVMEKTAKAAVVALDAGWSDVGSWAALHDVLDKDAVGNVHSGDVLLERCSDTYAVGTSRLVAAVGLENVVIVETVDAVLVIAKDHAQHVKQVVEALANRRR
jgi:mannose-1-phosphate guanylyltransferase/mannose-6-phosphate isomerase